MSSFWFRLGKTLVLCLGLVSVSACASIVEGSTQTVTVTTEPPGAQCDLNRGEVRLAVVNPTPGSVSLEKSKDNVAVICRKDGHEDSAGTLGSTFQAMTIGNILFGGLVGVAIDASSGAMNKYPASINVLLVPREFPSEADRDTFYDGVVARVRSDAAAAIAKIQKECAPDAAASCKDTISKIEAERDAEIESLAAKRQRSIIVASSASR